jgi:hypothetical protein
MMAVAAGQKIRASDYNADQDRIRKLYQKADQTRNASTAFLASPDLVFAVTAGAFYAFDACIMYDTDATADFKHEWLLPAGSGINIATWTSTTTGTLVDAAVAHDVLTGFSYASGGVALGTVMSTRPAGIIAIGGTGGTLTIRFAQNVSAAINTKLKLGSWVELTKVA